jgi:hypothetical protein
LNRQRQKLLDQEEEAYAKILHLQKMRRLLDDCEEEILKCRLETLDKLDTAEAAEKAELAAQESRSWALAEASLFLEDPILDPVAFADLPASFFLGLGTPGTESPWFVVDPVVP